MTPEQLEVIGLPEDATDEQITDRPAEIAQIEANADGDETPDPNVEPEESDEDEDQEDEEEDEETSDPSTQPQNLAAAPGTVLLDKKQYENMQAGLVDLLKFREEQAIRNRDEVPECGTEGGQVPHNSALTTRGLCRVDAATLASSSMHSLQTPSPSMTPWRWPRRRVRRRPRPDG
jgi:hypothetical protein